MSNNLQYLNDDNELQNDLIGVDNFLQTFSTIIDETNYKVYGLAGSWGTGKTTFIKIWENKLTSDQYIHINAFEKDYESNAFLIIFSAVYKYLQSTQKYTTELSELLKESKKFLINVGKATGKLAVNVIANKVVGSDSWKAFSNDILDSYFDDIVQKTTEEENLHTKLVEKLEKITSQLEHPLYVVVDELDRCRPTFALEILEKIKHIFCVKNIKYILVYSEEIFAKIIEKEYGLNDGGVKYLNKFIDRKIYLEYPLNIKKWFFQQVDYEFENRNGSYASVDLKNLYSEIVKIKEEFSISLRDFIKIISGVNNYYYVERIDYFVLLTIEFVRYINEAELREMIKYIRANDHFSSNLPSTKIFDHIILKLIAILNIPQAHDKVADAHNVFIKLCENNKFF